ncbi:MAG: Alkaline phosphatase [Akkermansiaceae bacterium]|nr:Alkaline phosphatase [Akkermansiaceae bacterium]
MKPLVVRSLFISSLLVASISSSSAATAVIAASDQGWYDATDLSWVANPNYAVGKYDDVEQRSWFVFTLPAVAPGEGFTAATLLIDLPSGGYQSTQPTETFTLYSVTTSAGVLGLRGTQAGVFSDLGTGTVYGQTVVQPSGQGTTIQLTLSAQALTDMTAAGGGTFVIGGAATSLVPANHDEAIFGFSSNGGGVSLSYTTGAVPEPGAVALLGCFGAAALLRKRRHS